MTEVGTARTCCPIEVCELEKPQLRENTAASFEQDTFAASSVYSGAHGSGMQLLETGGDLAKRFRGSEFLANLCWAGTCSPVDPVVYCVPVGLRSGLVSRMT